MSYTNSLVNIMRYPLASQVICIIPGGIIGGLLGYLLITPSDAKGQKWDHIPDVFVIGGGIGVLIGCGISAYIDFNANKYSLLCSTMVASFLYHRACGFGLPNKPDNINKCFHAVVLLTGGALGGAAVEFIGSSAYQAVQYCRS